jgi:glycosyltransferase involved in cell wall biosynthesis
VAKPAILVLTSTFPRWEGDNEPPFVFELCRRLTPYYEVHVSAPHAPGSLTRETLDGVHVHRFRYLPESAERIAYEGGILPKLRKRPHLIAGLPVFLLCQLRAAVRLARELDVKAIHAHWVLPQGVVALAARRLSGRSPGVVCTLHGADLYGLRGGVFDRLRRTVVNRTDRVTVVSRAMQRDLAADDSAKVSVIPMGVDLKARFTPGAARRPGSRLLFVGRLVEKKGLGYLLEAMPSIRKRWPQASLQVVGSGPAQPECERIVREAGLAESVRFSGAVRNAELPDLYRSADVLVFPSVVGRGGDREGFGLVLVEAMGCGCAVAASDLPAVRDIVRDGDTGVLFPPANPAGLCAVVVGLLVDAQRRGRLARSGRAFVLEHFDWERTTRRYKGLLDELVRT